MIERDKTVLAVIDFQDKLLPKIPVADAIIARAAKLIRFARELSIPILWTEQYRNGLGPTNSAIVDELDSVPALEKMAFSCVGDAAIAGALSQMGRSQLLLTGVEAHICVMQTGLQALEKGYQVFVARDAVASRVKSEYKAGLARMQRAGAELVTVEMAMFELLRVAGTPEFKKVLPLLK
ncbi:MAG: isochorismatase family protein [Candidatus Hydrogenedentes bacterium]|nr:isochorismatase family protein [Candidatus Hydrogenedentota bacterium]